MTERTDGDDRDGPATRSARPVVELRGITKRFSTGTLANDHMDLTVAKGEIHALLGENGAGKTTLMNILYGLLAPDEGEILIDGERATISGPADAIARGIGMVHQHFMLIPVLSVAENVILGDEVTKLGGQLLDLDAARERVRQLAKRLGFEVDPGTRVSQLSVGQQQRIELLKAVYRDARILVLDEPTAVLTPQETREIFAVLRRLREQGASIIFISHKLDEVLEIADRITVIRRGKIVGERRPSETSAEDLAQLMVGREVLLRVDRGAPKRGAVVLDIRGLRVNDDRKHEMVRGVDLQVHAGEIVGIAGVAGNGQDELVAALVGLRKPTAGTMRLDGTDVARANIDRRRDIGIAFVPADRQRYGLVLPYELRDNLILTRYAERPYVGGLGGFIRQDGAIDEAAKRLIQQFDIRAPSERVTAATLSGGNQQKVIVAREFRDDLKLMVLDQPTRGLDVGSIEFIHRQVLARRDQGVAVLLVSAELDEILGLSDRILVMYRGEIVGEFDAREAQRDRIGLLMAKGRPAAA